MVRYLDLVQESLQDNYKQLEARYAEITGESATGLETASYEIDEDDYCDAVQDFPQLVLLSFIVIWYSIVETVPSIEYCKSLVDFARKLFRKLYADLR